jgi:hypothetical protein
MTTYIIPESDLKVEVDGDSLGQYQFGAETAHHYFCKSCGIYTHHETARKAGHYRFNLGCIDGVESLVLDSDVFDGKHLL